MKTNFKHTKKKTLLLNSMKSRLGGKNFPFQKYRCYLSNKKKKTFPLSLKRVKKLIERRFLL